jgi:hypothetical protein
LYGWLKVLEDRGLLVLGAMFLTATMQIPGYANVVWFVLIYSAIVGPAYAFQTHRRLKREKRKALQKTMA